MAGRNLWHKPYFQPELNSVNKFASSKDRYLWERQYNHHLLRLQNIQTRPTYKPKIMKREYRLDEVREVEAEKAKKFYERTRLNTLPLDSRPSSPSSSRRSSRRSSEVSGVNHSPNISPRISRAKWSSLPNSLQSLYPSQNYPIFKRNSQVPKQTTHDRLRKGCCQKTFKDSDTFFRNEVSSMWDGLPNCCNKTKAARQRDTARVEEDKVTEDSDTFYIAENQY